MQSTTPAILRRIGPVAALNREGKFTKPIYVGKAVPQGARKGGFGLNTAPGNALYNRLGEHAKSIGSAQNLNADHFFCRYLISDDIWIPLGESLLIQRFQPIWNVLIDGFGNHTTGKRRASQNRSPWDTIHPGRPWAALLPQNPRAPKQFHSLISKFLKGIKVPIIAPEDAVIHEEEEDE